APRRLGGADDEQVVLAEVAAVRRVLGVARDGQLVGLHDDVLDTQRGGQRARLFEVVGGWRGGHGGQRQAARPEHLVRDAQEEGGVDAARERDQRRVELREQAPQARQLVLERHRQMPSAWNSLVVRYRSPVPAKMVSTAACPSRRRATRTAAAPLAPEETPARTPSSRALARVYSVASSSVTASTSS